MWNTCPKLDSSVSLSLSLSLLTQFLSCKGVSSTTVQGCMNYSERESNIQHGEYAQQRALFNFCLNDNLTRIVECNPRVSFRICLSLSCTCDLRTFSVHGVQALKQTDICCAFYLDLFFFTIRRGKIICTSGSSIIIYYSEHPLIDGVLFCATDT